MSRSGIYLALSVLGVFAISSLERAVFANTVRTVALSGQPAPGTGDGVYFDSFRFAPPLNDAGQTSFVGVLTGSGVSGFNTSGIWSEGTGQLELVARGGGTADAVTGLKFTGFSNATPLLDAA